MALLSHVMVHVIHSSAIEFVIIENSFQKRLRTGKGVSSHNLVQGLLHQSGNACLKLGGKAVVKIS